MEISGQRRREDTSCLGAPQRDYEQRQYQELLFVDKNLQGCTQLHALFLLSIFKRKPFTSHERVATHRDTEQDTRHEPHDNQT